MNAYAGQGGYWAVLAPVAFIAVAIARNARTRNLRIERMWIAPTLILVAVAMAFSGQQPPGPTMIAVDVLALVLGAGVGWWRGRFTHITVDPQTHDLTSRASPVGMLLIAAVFVLRMVVRGYATQNAQAWHVSVTDITDAFLLLAVGVVCAQRLEMALRATRLLNAARGQART